MWDILRIKLREFLEVFKRTSPCNFHLFTENPSLPRTPDRKNPHLVVFIAERGGKSAGKEPGFGNHDPHGKPSSVSVAVADVVSKPRFLSPLAFYFSLIDFQLFNENPSLPNTPDRKKPHLVVPTAAVFFNLKKDRRNASTSAWCSIAVNFKSPSFRAASRTRSSPTIPA